MSQDFQPLNPSVPDGDTGATLAAKWNAMRTTLLSSHSGSTPPPYAIQGTPWLDTSSVPWASKLFDGADWVTLYHVDPTTNTPSFPSDAVAAATADLLTALQETYRQAGQIPVYIERPVNKAYPVLLRAKYAMVITSVIGRSGSGSCTLTVEVAGSGTGSVPVPVISASETERAHERVVAPNALVGVRITDNAACLDLACNIHFRRL